MNTVGIITEYNPFHYGHLYHLQKAKEVSGSDTTICIMNGNFVQRGKAAMLDKWVRTKMALANGVDMVIELPLLYGIRSAEYFATGSIGLLDKTGIVDSIVFGSEAGNILPLNEVARLLTEEDNYFKSRLQNNLVKGLAFPIARENAIKEYLSVNPDDISCNPEQILEVLSEPNNILGIEYIKALMKLKPNIKPYTIKRMGSSYHSRDIDSKIASATAIRKKIYREGPEAVKTFLPEETYSLLSEKFQNNNIILQNDYLGIMQLSAIRKLNTEQLREFSELDNGLENRIYNEAHSTGDIDNLIEKIKTKSFTRTRIQRNLLHIFFNIREKDFRLIDRKGPQYIRVLGVRNERKDLLSRLHKNSSCQVIINPAKHLSEIKLSSKDPVIKSLSYDILASDIYSLLYKNPTYRQGHKDFTTPLITY